MTSLGTSMVASTMWTVASFRAIRVLQYLSSVMDLLQTVCAAITTTVSTAENVRAWLRAVTSLKQPT